MAKEKNAVKISSAASNAAAALSASAVATNLCDSLELQEQLGANGDTTYNGMYLYKARFGGHPNPNDDGDTYVGGQPVSFLMRVVEAEKTVHLHGPFIGFIKPVVLDPRVAPYTLPEMDGWPKRFKNFETAEMEMMASIEEACVVSRKDGVRIVALKGAVDYETLPLRQSEWVRQHVSRKSQKEDPLYAKLLERASKIAAEIKARQEAFQKKTAHKLGLDAEYEQMELFVTA